MTEQELTGLLASYPRRRPPLPEAYRRIYEREYQINRGGTTLITRLSQQAEGWMHRRVAANARQGAILEIGAGTLNHVPYEQAPVYDAIEPFAAAYANSPHRERVRTIFEKIEDVPKSSRYDRIISVAVLEHLTDLPSIVARTGLLLAEGGCFQNGIPTEGAFLWGAAVNLTTGLAYYLRNRLPYRVIMRHEHVNRAAEIVAVIQWFFEDVQISRFPTPLPQFSMYTAIDARRPKRERCRAFLEGGSPTLRLQASSDVAIAR